MLNLPFTYLTIVVFFVYIIGLELFIPFDAITYADEILLVLSIFSILVRHNKSVSRFRKVFILYFAYCCLLYLISPYSASFTSMLLQSFINLKVPIIALAIVENYNAINTISLRYKVAKMVKITTVFFGVLTVVTIALNIIMGESWMYMWNLPVLYRNDMLRIFGFFESGGYLGFFITFMLTTLYYIRNKDKFTLRHIMRLMAIIAILTIIISYRKMLLIFIPVIMVYMHRYKISFAKKIAIYTLPVVIFVTSTLFLDASYYEQFAKDLSYFTTADSDYIRGLIFYNGLVLAVKMFPFGTGPATFGTNLSQYNYKAYAAVDMEKWLPDFRNTDAPVGLFDNYFGAIVAEYGIIGIIIIVFLLNIVYKHISFRLNKHQKVIFDIVYIYLLLSTLTGPFIASSGGTMIFSLTLLVILTYEYKVQVFKYQRYIIRSRHLKNSQYSTAHENTLNLQHLSIK